MHGHAGVGHAASTASSSTRPAPRRRPGRARSTGKPHVGGHVLDVAVHVGLAELVARQRRAAARAVGDDLDVLEQQARRPRAGGGATTPTGRSRASASSRRRPCRPRSRCARSAAPSPRRRRSTDSRHRSTNSATPYASIWSLPEKPRRFSTSTSTGSPWVSQPGPPQHPVARASSGTGRTGPCTRGPTRGAGRAGRSPSAAPRRTRTPGSPRARTPSARRRRACAQ